MFRVRQYIAIALLGIFLFPVVYQSVHIVRHNAHCSVDPKCSCPIDNPETPATLSAHETEDDPCPVCHYQFPVNSPATSSFYTIFLPIQMARFDEKAIAQTNRPLPSACIPRAPPLFPSS